MIEQEIIEGTSGSGRRGRISRWRPARRSTLAAVAAGAMLLAGCGTASAIGHGVATPTPADVASSVTTGSTGRDADVLGVPLPLCEWGRKCPRQNLYDLGGDTLRVVGAESDGRSEGEVMTNETQEDSRRRLGPFPLCSRFGQGVLGVSSRNGEPFDRDFGAARLTNR